MAKKYDAQQIALELDKTALGIGYFGNSLRVAKDFTFLSAMDRWILDAWLTGKQNDLLEMPHIDLEDVAIKIRRCVGLVR